jgi:hypothetical protein
MRDKAGRSERDWTPPAGFGPLIVLIAWVLTVVALAALAFSS